jgi:hypothetical protein
MQKFMLFFSKCDNVIENIQIHMSWQIVFNFFVWKFAQMWRINMKREFFFYIFENKVIKFPKIEKDFATFPCKFWFGSNFLNVYIGS